MTDTPSNEVRARLGVATWNLLRMEREEFARLWFDEDGKPRKIIGIPVFYVSDPFEVWPTPQEGVTITCPTDTSPTSASSTT